MSSLDQIRIARACLLRLAYFPHDDLIQFVTRYGPVRAVERLLDRAAPPSVLNGLRDQATLDDAHHDLRRAPLIGARLLIPEDPNWPREAFTAGIARAPFALWVRGEGDLRDRILDAVTITGAHIATPDRVSLAGSYAADLAAHGMTVVTTAGYGTDERALQAATDTASDQVICLSASGVDITFPHDNEHLIAGVLESGGLIVSAAPLGANQTLRHVRYRGLLAAALGGRLLVLSAPSPLLPQVAIAKRAAHTGLPVYAVPPSAADTESGITHLIDHGHAVAVDSPAELRERLDALRRDGNHSER